MGNYESYIMDSDSSKSPPIDRNVNNNNNDYNTCQQSIINHQTAVPNDTYQRIAGGPQRKRSKEGQQQQQQHSNDNAINIAINKLNRAILLDEKDQYQGAYMLYNDALKDIMDIIKNENDENRRNILITKMNQYLTRAEELKLLIDNESSSSSKPPTSIRSRISPPPPPSSSSSSSSSSIPSTTTTTNNNNNRKKPHLDQFDYTGGKGKNDFKPIKLNTNTNTNTNRKTTTTVRSPIPFNSRNRKSPINTNANTNTNRKISLHNNNNRNKKSPKNSELEEMILGEMLDHLPGVSWNDIAGLSDAKQILQEAVILPNLRPDLFIGLRAPPKGVLLFGPPGTGKTMLAKAVASESGFTFFNISASSLMSKYLGEGEKLVRTLFDLAKRMQPSVIFMDEIDSLLSSRRENEHEASRRLKTEFMIQLDGANSNSNSGNGEQDRVLVMGATNLPTELDEAVLRRFTKKIYIPLPDIDTRRELIQHLLNSQKHNLTNKQITDLIIKCDGYSCSDLNGICKEAAMEPIRDLGVKIRNAKESDVRAICFNDFTKALQTIRPTVSKETLENFRKWHEEVG